MYVSEVVRRVGITVLAVGGVTGHLLWRRTRMMWRAVTEEEREEEGRWGVRSHKHTPRRVASVRFPSCSLFLFLLGLLLTLTSS